METRLGFNTRKHKFLGSKVLALLSLHCFTWPAHAIDHTLYDFQLQYKLK